MRKILIALIIINIGCNSNPDQAIVENETENLDYSGFLLPKLVADERAIWDFYARRSADTLTRSIHQLSFQMLNYSKYADKSLDNSLIRIDKIDFKLKANGFDTLLSPDIKDSVGVLSINLDTITSTTLSYEVDMNLKFKETDSTLKYSGIIYLKD